MLLVAFVVYICVWCMRLCLLCVSVRVPALFSKWCYHIKTDTLGKQTIYEKNDFIPHVEILAQSLPAPPPPQYP